MIFKMNDLYKFLLFDLNELLDKSASFIDFSTTRSFQNNIRKCFQRQIFIQVVLKFLRQMSLKIIVRNRLILTLIDVNCKTQTIDLFLLKFKKLRIYFLLKV